LPITTSIFAKASRLSVLYYNDYKVFEKENGSILLSKVPLWNSTDLDQDYSRQCRKKPAHLTALVRIEHTHQIARSRTAQTYRNRTTLMKNCLFD